MAGTTQCHHVLRRVVLSLPYAVHSRAANRIDERQTSLLFGVVLRVWPAPLFNQFLEN